MTKFNLWMGASVTLLMIVGIAYFHGNERAKKAASDSVLMETLKNPGQPDAVGQRIPLKDLNRAAFTLMNFWASWCTICDKDAVQLAALQEEFGAKFAMVGVVTMDLRQDLLLSGKLIRHDSTQFFDEDGLLAEKFRVRSLPTTILLDQNKNPILRQDGALDAEFRLKLASLLAK